MNHYVKEIAMLKSNKTKSERFVDISFLLFFERDMGPLQSLTVPLSFLVEKNGIYGDSGKRDAFQAAIELSQEKCYLGYACAGGCGSRRLRSNRP